jgi:hypothetical protein
LVDQINVGEEAMQEALALDRTKRRHCLAGQFRFTEWVATEPAEEKVRAALAVTEQDGFEVVNVHSRNGVVWARLKQSVVPHVILLWFEHFEKKGIPTGIVKNRVTGEYAIIREGIDLNDDEDDGEPEVFSKPEIMLLRKCNGFSLRLEEY